MTKYAGVLGGVKRTRPYTLISKITKGQSSYVPIEKSEYGPAYVGITTFSNIDVDQLLISLRAENVKIETLTEIKDFLLKHDDMVVHMYDIPSKISEYFGKANIKLNLFRDFDSETNNPEISIEVKTSLSPQEANERLGKIYKEWFIPLGVSLGKLNISLNFS